MKVAEDINEAEIKCEKLRKYKLFKRASEVSTHMEIQANSNGGELAVWKRRQQNAFTV